MFQVLVLGTSSAIPTNQRRLSGQVVTVNDRHHLIDCGEGTQMQLLRYKVKLSRLDAIFISHLHGDHVLGLPGLLNSLALYERNFPLFLFGPSGLDEMLEVFFRQTHGHLGYDLVFTAIDDYKPGDVIYEKSGYRVSLLPLNHSIFCCGYKFEETNKKPKFNFYKAKSMDIPNQYFGLLKQGNQITLDDGRTIQPEDVLLPADPPNSYAYCSDTCYYEELVEYISETQLLYHEATFLHNMKSRASNTFHSTALEAGTIAQMAQVNHLLLGHYSARYRNLTPLLEEARSVFPKTDLASEGDVYNLKDYV